MKLSWIGIVCMALLGGCGEAASSSADQALAGVWRDGPSGLYFSQTYDPAGGGLDRRATLFVGDQWAENPKGELSRFDFAAAAPAASGHWSFAGDRLTLTPLSGRPRDGKVVLNPDKCFDFRDGIWCPATPFATSKIDGAYSGGASYGAAAVAGDYVFAPDGTYRLLAGGSFKDGEDPAGHVTAAGETTGHYRIEGFTLILTASDGTERRDIAFPFGESADPAQPPMIYFGGWLLTRQAR